MGLKVRNGHIKYISEEDIQLNFKFKVSYLNWWNQIFA